MSKKASCMAKAKQEEAIEKQLSKGY